MNIWDELGKTQVNNAEKYAQIFAKVVSEAKVNRYRFHSEMKDYGDYTIVCEDNRANSYFIHIVPKEVMSLFRKMQINCPNEFLGFSVLCGKKDGKDLRVSCFGVNCALIGRAMVEFSRG